MSGELKPCPFCGPKYKLKVGQNELDVLLRTTSVQCCKCGINKSRGSWNTRQDERINIINEEILELLQRIKTDLLMRAEIEDGGCTVVNLSNSIWVKLNEVIGESKEIN